MWPVTRIITQQIRKFRVFPTLNTICLVCKVIKIHNFMVKKTVTFKQKKIVVVNRKKVEVWPSNQHVSPCLKTETTILQTKFDGPTKINENLAKAILNLENDPRFGVKLVRGSCGMKLHHIDRWKVPEAELIHARAIAFFINGLGFDQAVVDQCWANIYRKGDYCMPHSHVRSTIAIVYLVNPGDSNPDFPMDGKFYFCDPRVKSACARQTNSLTHLIMPKLLPGSMISFPGSMVHGVNPYNGDRPRITLSWNINRLALPGKPPDNLRQ